MDDVGTAKLTKEEWPVPQLGHDRSNVFNSQQPVEGAWWDRINRNDPGVDFCSVFPAIQHALRLNRLTAEDAERGNDDGDAQRTRWAHMAVPELPPAEVQNR